MIKWSWKFIHQLSLKNFIKTSLIPFTAHFDNTQYKMLIGISGNICAGKTEVARFLKLQGFVQLYLKNHAVPPSNPEHAVHAIHNCYSSPVNQQYVPSSSQVTTIPGTPLNQKPRMTEIASKETALDDESGRHDESDSDDAEGPSTSVKNLIHELNDLSTSEDKPTELPGSAQHSMYPFMGGPRRSNTYPMKTGASAAARKSASMALWELQGGEQDGMVVDTDGDEMELTFETVQELRDYVTRHWRTHYVTTDIWDLSILETLSQRPFFLHIAVDAPVSLRWTRFSQRQAANLTPSSTTSFDSFIVMCDEYMYSEDDGVAAVVSKARVTVVNQTQSLELLFLKLSNLDLLDPLRLRPSWDSYFMRLANLAALRSNCMKRRVGCVLVRDKRVIATGYNGTPRGLTNCNEGGCERCNDNTNYSGIGLGTCLCLHAEENALLESGRDRIGEGSILYCNTCPCLTCSIKIVQSGIREVVYLQPYSMDEASEKVLKSGNTILRQFIPPSEGIVM